VLLVIFGAGASYDSVAHLPLSGSGDRILNSERPPLANQLFENRPIFVKAMKRFPDCKSLCPAQTLPKIASLTEGCARKPGERYKITGSFTLEMNLCPKCLMEVYRINPTWTAESVTE
jgi:hypothetical protein